MTTNAAELSNKYQQKTDKQHILDNPDTYIGSVEDIDSQQWIISEDGNRIYEKNIQYIPALFKLFDEVIVNCRDHVQRMIQASDNNVPNTNQVSYIDITIKDNTIIMTNDGNGIDIAQHPDNKLWIPEMIFAHLRTSTNYDKTEKKIVGGKNGFGAKLVFIWAKSGFIETCDHVRGLKYTQKFHNNLDIIEKPVITKYKGKPFTTLGFTPDFARLGISGFTPDIMALLQKRVYDIAGVTNKNIKVKYNSQIVPVKNFQQYIDMYIGDKDNSPRVYEENGERWEYAVALSQSHEFVQISFVNGIHTSKGGKHVEYVMGQITRKLCAFIEKKKKIVVNANSIKEQLMLFLRCDIENPAFDSQTKDYMNTPSAKFGSSCVVNDKFIEKIAKMGVMDAACALTAVKENKAAKKTDGTKIKNVRGIPKLIDANWAGTEKSGQCIIIFCEGDSAKAGIVSGLSSEDRNVFGVYPMKGKILNVHSETTKKIAENKEIAEIKKILGLETGKEYVTPEDIRKNLRYGKVLIMTDQDLDGSHIKGLFINLFKSEWSSLLRIPGFIGFMNTPILKATKGSQVNVFYSEGEYQSWKEQTEQKGWKVKYYKGLGTSTGKEFKEYFEEKKLVGFEYNGKISDDAIDMVFNKKRADDRKEWLSNFDRESYLDTSKPLILYEEFINKEMIHYSNYDNDRSIPNLMDGLKISLRKILFSAFKKGLTSEIKVAQFSGYVSEHSGYHHGEASLNAAIVGMAQNFVGSNNINLLQPLGQYGSRLAGGKDSASERYIFTQLSKITRLLFQESDDRILKYLNDDGYPVEPEYYAPIIPMILVNGSKGIGTGFSTDIMCYNPLEIIHYLKSKLINGDNVITLDLEQAQAREFIPYYDGFNGTITRISESKFLIKGKYETVGADKIRITELPVGYWTDDFKEHLESLTDSVDKTGKKITPIVKDYDDMSKDTTVDFIITLQKGKLNELESIKLDNDCNGLEKQFHLYTTNTTTNMHMFDAANRLKKYSNVVEIIDEYFVMRLELFDVRKKYLIDEINKELILLNNKTKYIQENLDGSIDLRRKKRDEIVVLLKTKGYDIMDQDDEYKYLIKMPMDSVTEENVAKLEKEHSYKSAELLRIKSISKNQMWLTELNSLEKEYLIFKDEKVKMLSGEKTTKKKTVKKTKLIVDV